MRVRNRKVRVVRVPLANVKIPKAQCQWMKVTFQKMYDITFELILIWKAFSGFDFTILETLFHQAAVFVKFLMPRMWTHLYIAMNVI